MEKIERLLSFIKEANEIVFFGGAGVSTESGIPDFRSKDGLYHQYDVRFEEYDPEYLLSHDCLYYNTKVFYEFYRQKLDTRKYEPNVTHRVLAKLEKMGKLSSVITQNIDGLHGKAGSKNVLELHGSIYKNYCTRCKRAYSVEVMFDDLRSVPTCEDCKGMIRPHVVLYGEPLLDGVMERAVHYLKKADLLIVAGTSLNVYPAAGLLRYFEGKNLVVLNLEPLDIRLRGETDLMIEGNMGEVFLEIEQSLYPD